MTDEEMAEEYAHNHIHYEVARRKEGTYYAKEVSNVTVEQAFLDGLKAGRTKWHKVADGDLPECDEKTQLVFYVRDWNRVRNDYYNHFALGFYECPFIGGSEKLFVEKSKGYSSEHLAKNVVAWRYIEPPKEEE